MAFDPGISDDAVKAATGHHWHEWRTTLDTLGAATMAHPQIVEVVAQQGVGRWWRQMVAVGYERMVGKRAPGQRCDGAFSASASRTVPGCKDQAERRWLAATDALCEFDGVLAAGEPRRSHSDKWRYWRIDLDDGSKVAVVISDKAGEKAVVAVSHEKLADAAAAERAKQWWKALLAQI